TTELTAAALKDIIQAPKSKKITIQDIQKVVGEYYSVRIEDFSAKKRTKSIAYPRQIAMYLSRLRTLKILRFFMFNAHMCFLLNFVPETMSLDICSANNKLKAIAPAISVTFRIVLIALLNSNKIRFLVESKTNPQGTNVIIPGTIKKKNDSLL